MCCRSNIFLINHCSPSVKWHQHFFFRNIKYPDLSEILQLPNTVLLFPGDDAVDISELPILDDPYNLVALDGTWTQAKGMYINNALLKIPRKVYL